VRLRALLRLCKNDVCMYVRMYVCVCIYSLVASMIVITNWSILPACVLCLYVHEYLVFTRAWWRSQTGLFCRHVCFVLRIYLGMNRIGTPSDC
jgi:hypothetical protein